MTGTSQGVYAGGRDSRHGRSYKRNSRPLVLTTDSTVASGGLAAGSGASTPLATFEKDGRASKAILARHARKSWPHPDALPLRVTQNAMTSFTIV